MQGTAQGQDEGAQAQAVKSLKILYCRAATTALLALTKAPHSAPSCILSEAPAASACSMSASAMTRSARTSPGRDSVHTCACTSRTMSASARPLSALRVCSAAKACDILSLSSVCTAPSTSDGSGLPVQLYTAAASIAPPCVASAAACSTLSALRMSPPDTFSTAAMPPSSCSAPSAAQISVRRSRTSAEGSGAKRNRVQRLCSAGMMRDTWLQIRQKRVLRVYFSIPRRSANCASLDMASASSKIMSLKPLEKMRFVDAKSWIWLRTTSILRSSDAFSSSVMFW
mmetsp:Transcript_17700/g.54970  ORF Transcript_17700/g.54970 Transcript_17700/m.54970 type:complete len:285 (-) Transcript_17700:401-1255(-)